jgi:hypothetical protein
MPQKPSISRPVGVTASIILLGFFTLMLLGSAAVTGLLPVILHSNGMNVSTPPPPPPLTSSFITAIFVALALIEAAIGAWGLATVIGLFRMKSWARISILIIGGCLAAFALLNVFGTVISIFATQSIAMPAGASNPAALHIILIVSAVLWLIVGAIGAGWLIYFMRKPIREAFRLARHPQTALQSTAQLNPAYPITDFTIAQAIPPQNLPTQPVAYQPPIQPPQALAMHTTTARPLSMTVIAILMLVSGASSLIAAVIPIPLFLCGMILSGWRAHLFIAGLGLLYLAAGYGLLKLNRPAWMLSFVISLFGLANSAVIVLPSVRARFIAYTHNLTQSMMPHFPQYPGNAAASSAAANAMLFNDRLMSLLLIPSLLFGAAVGVVFMVLLWRARHAYQST